MLGPVLFSSDLAGDRAGVWMTQKGVADRMNDEVSVWMDFGIPENWSSRQLVILNEEHENSVSQA